MNPIVACKGRGVSAPLSLPEAVRRWLRAQLEFDPSVPLFRRCEWELTREADVDTLTHVACHFEYFDAAGNVHIACRFEYLDAAAGNIDKAAFVTTVRQWASNDAALIARAGGA